MVTQTQKLGPPCPALGSTYQTAAALTAALRSLKLLPISVLPALREAAYGRHTSCGKGVRTTLPHHRPGRRRWEKGTGARHIGGSGKPRSLRQTGQKQGPGDGCAQGAGGHGFFWQRIEPSWGKRSHCDLDFQVTFKTGCANSMAGTLVSLSSPLSPGQRDLTPTLSPPDVRGKICSLQPRCRRIFPDQKGR